MGKDMYDHKSVQCETKLYEEAVICEYDEVNH
jgi:hypothetical protein